MYDRRYRDQVIAFEPSGGLMNASLVMRDRETDSWWSIMTGDAIGGWFNGTRLKELPVHQKMQWRDWLRLYPDTKVLSVDGVQHVARDPYENYFTSDGGFRGLTTNDTRLSDKTSVYAFQLDGKAYAVTHERIEGGATFHVADGRQVFFYREPGWSLHASTVAYVASAQPPERFQKRDDTWVDALTGLPIEGVDKAETAAEHARPHRLGGFDTFWYIWATTHDWPTLLR